MAYAHFSRLLAYLQDPLFLSMRLFWGFKILRAGFYKLADLNASAESFANMGLSMPIYLACLVGALEFFGGTALFLGLYSRIWAFLLAIIMLLAYFFEHHDILLGWQKLPLIEAIDSFMQVYHFLYLFFLLITMSAGPGRFSLDWLRMRKKDPLNYIVNC